MSSTTWRFQHAAMATQFEIRCAHADERHARQAARAAFEVVDRLERQLSRFIENSDIARINHLAAGEHTIVSYETMQCLTLAQAMWRATGGGFDIAKGTGFETLQIVPGEFVVVATADGVSLDLGAIGKGLAVDRAVDVLEDWDVHRALIDAGQSSVIALDAPHGDAGWPLTLSEPCGGPVVVRLDARQRVLGASGIRKGDHIVHPRDQAPVRGRRAAWVSAPRPVLARLSEAAGVEPSPAAMADALSTAFMICDNTEIDAWCRDHPGVEAWILDAALMHFPMTMPVPS